LFVVKWFVQECHGPGLHRSSTSFFIVISSDENNRNSTACRSQLALQLQSVHARHLNVNDEARSIVQLFGLQETFARFKGSHPKAERLDEKSRGPTDGLIIVDYRD
jgi:hypothetical protein